MPYWGRARQANQWISRADISHYMLTLPSYGGVFFSTNHRYVKIRAVFQATFGVYQFFGGFLQNAKREFLQLY